MAMAAQGQRQKRWHSKVSTGCVTCKKRRIKCDQEKPGCRRCSTTNRTCEGYEEKRPWIFVPTMTTFKSDTARLPINKIPSSGPKIHDEGRAILFFNEKTSHQLAGFTSYTNQFWTSVVPQLSHSEPAIHHIIIALASRHEHATTSSPMQNSPTLSELCVRHHTRALHLLTQLPARSNIELSLISCIAFIAFENLDDPYGEKATSVDYIMSGLRILNEQSISSNSQYHEKEGLLGTLIKPMFLQVNLVLSIFCGPLRGASAIIRGESAGNRPRIPVNFKNLAEARAMFFEICRWRYGQDEQHRQHWSTSSEHFQSTLDLLSEWQVLMMLYRDNISESSDEAEPSKTLSQPTLTERERADLMLRQKLLMAGAIRYSAREDLANDCKFHPESIDLSDPRKIVINFRLPTEANTLDMSSFNLGRPALPSDSDVRLWPTARRLVDPGNHDIMQFTFSI